MTYPGKFEFLAKLLGVVAGTLIITLALLAGRAQAQTYTLIHSFTGGADGATPYGVGLTMDAAGNLYGGAAYGGQSTQACSYQGSCGDIYKLSRRGSGWVFSTIFKFNGTDGEQPDAPLVFGPDGLIYSTTFYGGSYSCIDGGCGVVYSLRPPATPCKSTYCPWTETVLHQFGDYDGARPAFGALAFDRAGNMYGTTTIGGPQPPYDGEVFEMTRSGSQWSLNVLHTFTGQDDGGTPWSGVVFDAAGNAYGTTTGGGSNGAGTIYQMTPSGGSWTLSTIHAFLDGSEGSGSMCNLLLDSSGNLWGTTRYDGPTGAGTAFELSPSGGGWNLNVLYAFPGFTGSRSMSGLLADRQGNLYGTIVQGGQYGGGQVFKLAPSGYGWIYTSLHDFYGTDGAGPEGQLVLDGNGNLYGTTYTGGAYDKGVVWEITP
jgi:uncharacterized repeat protein (TIGR03803 family)